MSGAAPLSECICKGQWTATHDGHSRVEVKAKEAKHELAPMERPHELSKPPHAQSTPRARPGAPGRL